MQRSYEDSGANDTTPIAIKLKYTLRSSSFCSPGNMDQVTPKAVAGNQAVVWRILQNSSAMSQRLSIH